MTTVGNPSGQNDGELGRLAEVRVSASVGSPSLQVVDVSVPSANELRVLQEKLLNQSQELHRAQIALQEMRDQYAELYDNTPLGYLTVNEQGTILDLNLTAATLLREGRTQLIGQQLQGYFTQDSQSQLLEHIGRALASTTKQSCDLTLQANNSESLEVHLNSLRSKSSSANVGHCRIMMTDFSRCMRAEKALADREKYLKLLADALPVLVAYIDMEWRFEFCNAAHEVWFGNTPAALEGQHIKDVHEVDNYQLIAANLAEALDGKQVQVEIPLQHPTLGRRHFRMILVPDINMAGEVQGVHSLGIDATEQKILDQQIERRRAVLARLGNLNAAERAVYDLLASGKSNQFIATALDIGLRTAERRRQTILNKLQVESLAQWLQQLADVDLPNISPHRTS